MDTFQGHLDGQYIILAHNSQHAQALLNSEQTLLHSLIKNHIPILYQEDLVKMPFHIAIIPDYFITHPILTHDVLSFQCLFGRNITLKKLKKKRTHKQIRSCIEKYPIKEERLFQILNIDRKRDAIINDEPIRLGHFQSQVDARVHKAFTNEYWFGVLIVTYEKLGFSHIDLLNEVIRLYIQKRNDRQIILRFLNLWLQYRYVDLINDCSSFCTHFLQFIELLKLFVDDLDELQFRINTILAGKKQNIAIQLSSPSPTGQQRKQSFQQNQKPQKFRNQSLQMQVDSEGPHQKFDFDGNHFYLNCSSQNLQRQFWIVDVELYSRVSISSEIIKNNEISDYFDYLLFHMIFSTIVSTKEQKYTLIIKFIELYVLSKEAHHYQLMHVLYCYFNHQIIQQICQNTYPLNPLNKLILEEILEKELYKTIIPIDINNREGIIPCYGMICLYLYKFQDIKNETKWTLYAQQLFQISHLQMLIKLLNDAHLNYRDDYIIKFIKNGTKKQLKEYFGCNKQSIEIQMFKIFQLE